MTPSGGADRTARSSRVCASRCKVEYYLRAVDLAGNARNSPALAPAALHTFDVATSIDDMETGHRLVRSTLEGTDNATNGIWERVDPVATEAQPENDHTPDPGVALLGDRQRGPGPAGRHQ